MLVSQFSQSVTFNRKPSRARVTTKVTITHFALCANYIEVRSIVSIRQGRNIESDIRRIYRLPPSAQINNIGFSESSPPFKTTVLTSYGLKSSASIVSPTVSVTLFPSL